MIHTRYDILQPLGAGAFGQTYLAKDTTLPDQPFCVVKQLKPKINDPESWKVAKVLFEREATTLSQLGTHEQIPQLLDAFEAEQEFYLVQEYIEGKTVREELDHHKCWSEPQVTLLLQEILKILAFIHSQGIIHRDIKPENIIRRSHDRTLFLIDFGAVKQISHSSGEQTSLTIVHTCGYSPPEQLEGMPEPGSDLYALGMTCIEALTGIKPELLKQCRNTKTREIDWSQNIAVSNEFKSILDKMICMDSRDRYSSVDRVMRALNSLSSNINGTYTPTEIIIRAKVTSDSNLDAKAENDGEQKLESRPTVHTSRTQARQKPDFNRVSEALSEGSKAGKKVKRARDMISNTDHYIKENVVFLLRLLALTFAGLLIVAFLIQRISTMSRSTQQPQVVSGQNENSINQDKAVEEMAFFDEQGLLQEHQAAIKLLAFTSDGQTLISASEDGSVKLRNLQTQAVQLLTQTQTRIMAIAKSANGESLAIATEGKAIEIWDLKTHKRIHQFLIEQLAWSLALSNDGQVLAEGGLGRIKVWKKLPSKPKSPENYTFIFNSAEPIQATTLSSDTHIVVGGNRDGRVKLFNLLNNTSHTFNGHAEAVNSVVIDVSDSVLLTGSADDTLRLWDIRALQELSTIQAGLGEVKAIAIHPKSNIVAAGGSYGGVKLWDWRTGKLLSSFSNHLADVTTLAFSPDGQMLVVGDRDGKVVIYTSKNRFVNEVDSQ